MMGDSQLSDPGFGPPVDALDTTCRRYKDCLRYKNTVSTKYRIWPVPRRKSRF